MQFESWRGITVDKYEYKVRKDEINALIAEGEFAKAVEIADTIDWKKVKSVMMLCKISDLYKINRRYQESKDILLMAYERHPGGRLIVYSLCELSLKLGEYVAAVEYFKEFSQLAPRDTSRYILQYRLYEAQEVSLEERIAVLEEFKKKEYKEKWAYELAYLYHRIGLESKCIDECDEIFLWFGEGRYVMKALELKQLHTPLSAEQQEKYNLWIALRDAEAKEDLQDKKTMASVSTDNGVTDMDASTDEADLVIAPTTEIRMDDEEEIQVKPVDVGQFNTMNIQQALADSMKEFFNSEEEDEVMMSAEQADYQVFGTGSLPENQQGQVDVVVNTATEVESEQEDGIDNVSYEQDLESMSGMELQEEVYFEEPASNVTSSEDAVPFSASELTDDDEPVPHETFEQVSSAAPTQIWDANALNQFLSKEEKAKEPTVKEEPSVSVKEVEASPIQETPPKQKFESILSQEYDGQIKIAVPSDDEHVIEKQITGQLSIEDIMTEWEQMKKDNEKKRMEEVRQRILQHTGSLFDEFDEQTKSGLLEQLEKAFVEAIIKESKGSNVDESAKLHDEIQREAKKAADRIIDKFGKDASAVAEEIDSEVQMEVSESDNLEKDADESVITQDDTVEEIEEIEEPNEVVIDEEVADAETINTEDINREDIDIIENVEEDEVVSKEPESPEDVSETNGDEQQEEAESVAVKTIQKALGEDEGTADKDQQKPEENPVEEEPVDEEADASTQDREMSDYEEDIFGSYASTKKVKRQILHAIDHMSMAAYIGNVIITGEPESGTMDLAKDLIKEIQATDKNFMGQVAKISGQSLNKKDIESTLEKLEGGALIIQAAGDMQDETANKLAKALNKENKGIIVILEDTASEMDDLLNACESLKNHFDIRVDLESLDDDALVEYARQYVREQEFSIDPLGELELHRKIANRQTSDHQVTTAEVREIMDDAMYYASKRSIKHFMDVLLSKRYDEEDMIILRDKDFMHNS